METKGCSNMLFKVICIVWSSCICLDCLFLPIKSHLSWDLHKTVQMRKHIPHPLFLIMNNGFGNGSVAVKWKKLLLYTIKKFSFYLHFKQKLNICKKKDFGSMLGPTRMMDNCKTNVGRHSHAWLTVCSFSDQTFSCTFLILNLSCVLTC